MCVEFISPYRETEEKMIASCPTKSRFFYRRDQARSIVDIKNHVRSINVIKIQDRSELEKNFACPMKNPE